VADWTAITGIVVSGVVGPSVVAYWSAKRQASEAANAVALGDRSAARLLLDEAARAVREASGVGGALKSAALTWGAKLGIEGGKDEMQAFRKAGQVVDLLGPRVEIMFGRGQPVSAAFAECVEAVNRVARGANLMSGSSGAIDFRPYWEDVDQGLKELQSCTRAIPPRRARCGRPTRSVTAGDCACRARVLRRG
jgi:hypothetical protein